MPPKWGKTQHQGQLQVREEPPGEGELQRTENRKRKTSDAKLFLIQLQQSGKRYSTIKAVRGVLRPTFHIAGDDDSCTRIPSVLSLPG